MYKISEVQYNKLTFCTACSSDITDSLDIYFILIWDFD